MKTEDHIAGLASEIERFAAVVEKADLAAPVPGCPAWRLEDLVGHVGHVHRWVTHIIATRAQEPVRWTDVDDGKPGDASELAAWIRAGAGPLVEQLSGDPSEPVWGFGGNSRAWWARRMLHEMTVHRSDAELTLGLEPEIDPDVAVDGVDEFLHLVPVIMARRDETEKLRGGGESLHLHATDAPGEWTITLGPEELTWERGHTKATTAIRGKAADLLLLMWGRRRVADAERYQTFGDLGLAERWAGLTQV